MNLNRERIRVDCGQHKDLEDYSTVGFDGRVRVYFKNLADNLVRELADADAVVGCMAWLTHPGILGALAAVDGGVSIVVQKEDWLRPDLNPQSGWKGQLHEFYKALTSMERHEVGGLGSMSYCNDPTLDAVRCVGYSLGEKKLAKPRAHHKFVVMCKVLYHVETVPSSTFLGHEFKEHTYNSRTLYPFRIWTGSFNFTNNAENSFENAVVIDDPFLAKAFFNEYVQVASLSEPLDWTSEWVEPEWRIGS